MSINKSLHSLKHLSAVIPNFNIPSLVPLSCSGGYGTFFLIGLNCKSTDCLIEDSQPAQVWGWGCLDHCCSCSLSFSGHVVPLTPVCLAFITPSLRTPAPVFRVPTIWSVFPTTACHTLAYRTSGLKVPLASTEPFRPNLLTCLHSDSFSQSSLSTIEGSAHSGCSGFLFTSTAPPAHLFPLGSPSFPFSLRSSLSLH